MSNAVAISPQAGGTVFLEGDRVQLIIPPGAFTIETAVTLTRLTGQGLPAPLPLGWTPIFAVDIGPSGRSTGAALELTVRDVDANGVVAVHWDGVTRVWRRIDASVLMTEQALDITVSGTGAVAVVRPDVLPAAPAPAAVGEALAGVSGQPIPSNASADIVPSPSVLFMQPGARSQVAASLRSAAPLPSGTLVQVDVEETYDRTNGTRLHPEPTTQDFLLYQEDSGAESDFVSSPSEIFDPVLLREGVIRLSAHRPGGTEGAAVIGAGGGTVSLPQGITLAIPPGALGAPAPVTISAAPEAPPGLGDDPRFTALAGVTVDFGGAALATAARLTVQAPTPLSADAQVLVVQPVRVRGDTLFELVGSATLSGNTLTVDAGTAGLPLRGVRAGGRYFFVRMLEPVAFVTGGVASGGVAVDDGLVTIDTLPFVSRTNATSSAYVVASTLGSATVTGLDLTDGSSGSAEATLSVKAQIAGVDLELEQVRPTVVEVSPADEATGVSGLTAVTVRFSRAIDLASLNASSFQLMAGAISVAGSISPAPDGSSVTFRPTAPLVSQTLHTVRLTSTIHDQFGMPLLGNQGDGSFVSTFTTADVTPPQRPQAGQITVAPPVGGRTTISGTQGSVEPGASVTVLNLTSGLFTTVLADANGSFALSLAAGLTDAMQLRLRDPAGNETSVDLGRAPPPIGFGVIGEQGGMVSGEGGTAALIPPGVLPADTIVSVTPLDVSNIALPFSDRLPGRLGGAVTFAMGDVEIADVMEMVFSIDGHPASTIVDRVPLMEIDQQITLPADVSPGTTLTLRVRAQDKLGQSTEVAVDLPIVVANPDATVHTERVDSTPVVILTVPRQAMPGQMIRIQAVAQPPDIKLRFPADPDLTGNEQFILWEVREIAGRTILDLADSASLKTLDDGTRVIETNSPPYRGIRRDFSKVILAVYTQQLWAAAKVLLKTTKLASSGSLGALIGFSTAAMEAANQANLGVSLIQAFARPRPPDVSLYEFAVVPVLAGTPSTIQVVDLTTNNIITQADVEALPPNTFSSVLILGEDDNNPKITATTSFNNNAVPTDASIDVAFSHIIDTTTITSNTLFIVDKNGQPRSGRHHLPESGSGRAVRGEDQAPKPIAGRRDVYPHGDYGDRPPRGRLGAAWQNARDAVRNAVHRRHAAPGARHAHDSWRGELRRHPQHGAGDARSARRPESAGSGGSVRPEEPHSAQGAGVRPRPLG